MSIPSLPIQTSRSSRAGRLILGVLLLAALALAMLAIDTQRAQADVLVTAFNYISNGSFETSPAMPNSWVGAGLTSKDKRVCNQSQAGSCSFKFKADTDNKHIYQCKFYTGTAAGQQFKLKVWTKGKSVDLGSWFVIAFVAFYDGNTFINTDEINVPNGNTPWTLRQGTATAGGDYDEICVYVQTVAVSGTIWFDKLSLTYIGGP